MESHARDIHSSASVCRGLHEMVAYHLRSYLLLHGLTLAGMPSVSDVHHFLSSCLHIAVLSSDSFQARRVINTRLWHSFSIGKPISSSVH